MRLFKIIFVSVLVSKSAMANDWTCEIRDERNRVQTSEIRDLRLGMIARVYDANSLAFTLEIGPNQTAILSAYKTVPSPLMPGPSQLTTFLSSNAGLDFQAFHDSIGDIRIGCLKTQIRI